MTGGRLAHYLITLYRVLTRQRLYAALNILGLAVGVAVFLVLWLDVRFETNFERWVPHADQIYVLKSSFPTLGRPDLANTATTGAMLDVLRSDYPGLLGVRVWNQTVTLQQGGQVVSEKAVAVDPSFFQVFELPLVAGERRGLLSAPNDLVLSQSRARRYFGTDLAVGRQVEMSVQGQARLFRVSGVLKDSPADTDNRVDVLFPLLPSMTVADPYWRDWSSQGVTTYLRFASPEGAKALDRDLDAFIDRHATQDGSKANRREVEVRTEPLLAVHLSNPKDAAVVAGLAAVGLLTLILAAVNYINLATARAALRAREVAVRKVMGATQGALVVQFMTEAVATALAAAILGLVFCELALPLINASGGLNLKIDYLGRGSVLAPLLAAIAVLGLGAGVYPALILSRFQPAAVLAAARTPSGGRAAGRLLEGLVALQFAIAVAFTIGTAVILSQTHYLRHADLGFRRDGVILVKSFDDGQVTAADRTNLMAAWRSLPGVSGVTSADIGPGDDSNTSSTAVRRPGSRDRTASINLVQTGPDFFRVYGAHPVAGRFLDLRHGGDDTPPAAAFRANPALSDTVHPNVVLNASATAILGFASPAAAIGQVIVVGGRHREAATIVGVVSDIRFRSPHEPCPPTIYLMTSQDYDNADAAIQFSGADPSVIQAEIGRAWRSIVPKAPLRASTAPESLRPYYAPDDEHGRLFTLGAGLAVIIACVGLYGLASFSTARRIKEIGIRKTLGASSAEILRLLIGQFLRPVLLANLVAWPLAWLTLSGWLSGFDQRIALSPLFFLGATILTLAIAVGTVAGQAYAVARAEPAKALRHE